MPQEVREVVTRVVLDTVDEEATVGFALVLIDQLTDRLSSLLWDQPPSPETPPDPPPLLNVDVETNEVRQVDETEAWPTVMILRRTLQAVVEHLDYDEAMGVLLGQALESSAWAEQAKEEGLETRGG